MDIPAKKVSPDGMTVAIRTCFEDASIGPLDHTKAWLGATHHGLSIPLSEADVSTWADIPEPKETNASA